MQRPESHEPADLLDGIPHAVVGLTAFYTFVLAAIMMILWTGEQPALAAALVTLATPLVIARLARKAEHDRDHVVRSK